MIIRSKAPFRLGLAGGGTDVSPYSDEYGGAILNATVNLYAHTTLIPRSDGKIIIRATDLGKEITLDATEEIEINGELDLQKGVYNRIVKIFSKKALSFELTTKMDVPSGSGLGTSSTLVVSILGAFIEWLKLELTEYEIARLAYSIEREDLQMAGGKQDQYAAVFGGINFLEFGANNEVLVHPLDINTDLVNELEVNLLLFYTKTSRESSKIIQIQAENVQNKQSKPINAMHFLKEQAFAMKLALIDGDLKAIGQILNTSWHHKKMMADGISNQIIDEIYKTAMQAGAVGGKISGAGGGGFMIFYVNDPDRAAVIEQLHIFNGEVKHFEFCFAGLTTWTVH
ncbi:MAG: D-glycero-alpha-D-manno-heptose-7-phosphate kinase [Crocinitomix sp.]|jgi:D-glycero-alpha-D-manno-heptose-7-phosphate kinase